MHPSSPPHQEMVPEIQTNERHDVEQAIDRPILEVMEEMRTQLRMIDGETKAFRENSYGYLREAKNEVHKLREDNRKFRKKIAEHESVTDMVLDCISTEEWNRRLSNCTHLVASHVLELFDDEVAKKMNQLNLLRYQTRLKEARNGKLTTELNMLRLQSEPIHQTQLGHGPIMQAIRSVENKIEKVILKHSEMLHIGRTYLTIRDKLQEESFTYVTTADAMKTEIECCSRKLAELRPTYQDAELIRDKAKTELQRREELLYAHRKRNELEIGSLRRLVEVKKSKPVPQKNPMVRSRTDPPSQYIKLSK
ncbi:hypothetical protein P879_04030 [Paragonimus westermani]|uniref:DUF4201 domain-containing protein n=1 Tax=Paragonimus westermani TaxID=34504 RepID=A0A8T0DK55_9TREM|nr:hypothetical protein P879_04030 [Paragonimus westermani]